MKCILYMGLMLLPFWVASLVGEFGDSAHGTRVSLVEREAFLTTFVTDGELYLNIPDGVLDIPLLFVRYDGTYTYKFKQVVWSLENGKILLKESRIRSTSGTVIPLKQKRSLQENILAVFPVERDRGRPNGHCIRITDLVLHQVIEWKPGFTENLVPAITLLVGARDFDDEVLIKTKRGLVSGGSKVSIPVFYGFCALPKPMEGRAYDYRMGFYNEEVGGIDYDHVRNSVANISRWRLEKKDTDKGVSVPVRPITFVLSPDIPKKWRPYVKAGIEEWLPAFEEAGFREALVVKEVDSLSDWQAHRINTSVVHWGDARYLRGFDVGGGTVSNVVDLRSGQILKSDIHLGASLQNNADRYFVRCAPLDPRAQQFPFPDELSGALFQSLAAHEAGHAFGLMDSNFGEYAYPFDKMGDSTWLRAMGHTPSVMNYARENNIAQPGDSVPPPLLVQRVGPMDRYHIRWAYTEFPVGMAREQEEAALERMVRMQDTVPWLRYNNSKFEIVGPAESNEVVETNDPVESTKLALKNLERVIGLLPGAVSDQRDNARLEHLYGKTMELWYRHMRHVVSLVGGYDIQYKSINQPGKMYTPIPLEKQEEAMAFLMGHAFDPPDWLVHPIFMPKLAYSTHPDVLLEYQQGLVMELLRAQRLRRFEYLETLEGYEGSYLGFLSKLQKGLFMELYDGSPQVNRRRRELQTYYIDRLRSAVAQVDTSMEPVQRAFAYSHYSKGLLMGQLELLREAIKKKLEGDNSVGTMGHWKLCLYRLDGL